MKKASTKGLLTFKQSLIAADEEVAATATTTLIAAPIIRSTESCSRLVSKATIKEKLSVEEQIEYLECKGITFNEYSKHLATKVLSEQTYYYKVTAYRKNFTKIKIINIQMLIFHS